MDLFVKYGLTANTVQNGTNYTGIVSIHIPSQRNYTALFLLIIPAMTVFGNLLVVISVMRERILRTATNYLIISLALADLLVALCVMPFAVYVEVENGLWRLPKSLCTYYIAMDVCASTASILNLVAISWDRYVAVSKPIQYAQCRRRKNRCVCTMIISAWSISIVIASPMAAGLNRLEDTPYCEYTNSFYIIVSSFVSFYLPCCIMVALYTVVLKKLRGRERNSPSRLGRGSSRRTATSSYFQSSAHTNIETTSNNDLSIGIRVSDRGRDDDDQPVIGPSTVEYYQSVIADDQLTMTPSPGSAFTQGMDNRDSHSELMHQGRLMRAEGDFGQSIINNNNIMKTESTLDCIPIYRESPFGPIDFGSEPIEAGIAFQLDNESMPFIDASSLNGTPLHRKRTSSPQHCNGITMTRICPVIPMRQGSSPITDHDHLLSLTTSRTVPDYHLPRLESRRRSLGGFITRRLSTIGTLLPDRSSRRYCKRSAATSVSALAAKYSRQSRKERRATHTLAIVLAVFLICWLPFFTCHITISICRVISGDTCVNITAFFFTTWLGYTNSFMNPIIYTIFNPEYRRAFKSALRCDERKRRR